MAKWKKELGKKSDDQKQNIKYEPTPISSSKEKSDKHKNGSSKHVESSDGKKHSKGSSDKKKRHSEVSSEKLRNPEREEKKQKMSISDYKKDKGAIKGEFNPFESNENSNGDGSKNMYGLDEDLNNEDRYSPTPIKAENTFEYNPSEIREKKTEKKHHSSKDKHKTSSKSSNKLLINSEYEPSAIQRDRSSSESINDDDFLFSDKQIKKSKPSKLKSEPYDPICNNKPATIIPPVPSVSLENLFSDQNKPEPYEPENASKPSNSNLPRAPGGPRNIALANTISRTSIFDSKSEYVRQAKNDDEALCRIMRQKQSKRMIYTGRKADNQGITEAPSLLTLCTRVLVDNLDTLPNRISDYNMTHDFAIAFDLLKPVLEKSNAKQLEHIENYSPHFLSDTDYIWQKITEQEFKKLEPPEEDESWRELYFKKIDAREQQFQRARSIIVNKLQKEKPQERLTKMATLKIQTKHIAYKGPKSYNGERSGKPLQSTSKSDTYTKIIDHNRPQKARPRPQTSQARPGASGLHGQKVFTRAPPVMSQGMKAISRMMKSRRH